MKFKKLKQGFTLVELVVVIAVIAILSGASVGAYFGIISQANKSTDDQTLKLINDGLKREEIISGKPETASKAFEAILNQTDIDLYNVDPKDANSFYVYDLENNKVYIDDGNNNVRDENNTIDYNSLNKSYCFKVLKSTTINLTKEQAINTIYKDNISYMDFFDGYDEECWCEEDNDECNCAICEVNGKFYCNIDVNYCKNPFYNEYIKEQYSYGYGLIFADDFTFDDTYGSTDDENGYFVFYNSIDFGRCSLEESYKEKLTKFIFSDELIDDESAVIFNVNDLDISGDEIAITSKKLNKKINLNILSNENSLVSLTKGYISFEEETGLPNHGDSNTYFANKSGYTYFNNNFNKVNFIKGKGKINDTPELFTKSNTSSDNLYYYNEETDYLLNVNSAATLELDFHLLYGDSYKEGVNIIKKYNITIENNGNIYTSDQSVFQIENDTSNLFSMCFTKDPSQYEIFKSGWNINKIDNYWKVTKA